jgi:hypothetical protein
LSPQTGLIRERRGDRYSRCDARQERPSLAVTLELLALPSGVRRCNPNRGSEQRRLIDRPDLQRLEDRVRVVEVRRPGSGCGRDDAAGKRKSSQKRESDSCDACQLARFSAEPSKESTAVRWPGSRIARRARRGRKMMSATYFGTPMTRACSRFPATYCRSTASTRWSSDAVLGDRCWGRFRVFRGGSRRLGERCGGQKN